MMLHVLDETFHPMQVFALASLYVPVHARRVNGYTS